MNDGDLISRKALLGEFEWLLSVVDRYRKDDVQDSIQRIKNTPAVDAVEVVHSKWKLNDDGSGICMNCHRRTKNVWDYDSHMKYCPECGAKMDGERRSE